MASTSPDDIVAAAATDNAAQQAALNAATQKDVANNYYKTALGSGLGLLGGVAGVFIAIRRKSGLLGGVGWFFLIGTAGSAVGYVIGGIIDGKPK